MLKVANDVPSRLFFVAWLSRLQGVGAERQGVQTQTVSGRIAHPRDPRRRPPSMTRCALNRSRSSNEYRSHRLTSLTSATCI